MSGRRVCKDVRLGKSAIVDAGEDRLTASIVIVTTEFLCR